MYGSIRLDNSSFIELFDGFNTVDQEIGTSVEQAFVMKIAGILYVKTEYFIGRTLIILIFML